MRDNHIEGIDYLRAIMSVFVVAWHMGGGGRSLIFSKERYLEHVFTISDLINFHLLLLAVPVFIFISCFLYASREVSVESFRKRLRRILVLLTFWPIALIVLRNGYKGLSHLVPHSLGSLIVTMLTAGSTIYYFFVSLIVCLLVTHLVANSKLKMQIAGFALSVALLAILAELTKTSNLYPLGAHWNPLNFVPLSFAAVLIAQNRDYVRRRMPMLIGVSVFFFIGFSFIEWNYSIGSVFFLGQGSAIPAYTRASLVFGVIPLIIIATEAGLRSRKGIKFMAKYSLALYCIHPFLREPVRAIVTKVVHSEMLSTYASILIVVLLSYAMATVLRIYLKDEVLV